MSSHLDGTLKQVLSHQKHQSEEYVVQNEARLSQSTFDQVDSPRQRYVGLPRSDSLLRL